MAKHARRLALLSHPGSPSSQTVLDIRFQIGAGTSQSQVAIAQTPEASWAGNQFSQEISVFDPASCLPGDSYRFGLDADYAETLTDSSAASGIIQIRGFTSPQNFPEDAQLHVSHILCYSIGPLHMWHLQFWLKAQIPSHSCCLGCLRFKVNHQCIRSVAWKALVCLTIH